jgi:TolB-like protein
MIFKNTYRRLFVLLLFIPLWGCASLDGAKTVLNDSGKGVLKKIAVLPFKQAPLEEAAAGTVRCPLCGFVFSADKLSGRPEKVVENIFVEHLRRYEAFHLISGEQVQGTDNRVPASTSAKTDFPGMVQNLGSQLGADAVVVGYVYRFRERVGHPYAVKQSASVMFHIHLVRVDDGVTVWKSDFDKTQKSLLENVLQLSFFYREKGRWLTAEELTAEGIGEILKTFPGIRKEYR